MKTHLKRLGKLSLTLLVLLALMLAAREGWFDHLTDSNWVARFVKEGGLQAMAVLLMAGSLFTAVGGPRQAIAFVCGFAMGGFYGALFSTLAAVLGCLMSFYFARLTVRSSLRRRFGYRLERFEALIASNTWLKVLMIRLLPVGSNLLTNLLAGTTKVGVGGFVLGSAIGYLPQMLIFSFAGAGIGLADHVQLGISIGLFVLSSAIGAFLYRSHLKRQVDELAEEA
ncbi:VTT domain-containing protein [Shewanella sp. 3B26]|uniref:TVP38/TMEM64 family membrane protein n=1 Tax=Shewanella zhuhaiensis TaxID=2919576 RepID=A0AAJ1EZG2_9GAMM|nr:VTT domain-containing protein [Shewanella zhuhaiensis]MCH4296059.1 VTT domain-containing protein [Shewanella zhuhaiensis]